MAFRPPRLVTALLGLAALLTNLSGCSTRAITMDSLAEVHRGMNPTEVEGALGDRTPNTMLVLQDEDASVAVYDMVTGSTTMTTSTYVSGVNGGPGHMQMGTTSVATTEPYFLLYRNGALEYWGFLDEFGRDEDPGVREFRDPIATKYQEYLKKWAIRRGRGQGAFK